MMRRVLSQTNWTIKCKVCGRHRIPRDGRWVFNGNLEFPTFTPSIDEKVNQPNMEGYNRKAKSSRCHFTITNGMISYQGGCSHGLTGSMLLEPFTLIEIKLEGDDGIINI